MGCCLIVRPHRSTRSPLNEDIMIYNFEARPMLKLSKTFIFDIHNYKLSTVFEVGESLEDSPVTTSTKNGSR